MRARAIVSAITILAAGCAPVEVGRLDEVTLHPDADPIAPFTECSVYTAREPASSRGHVATCSALEPAFHPPASGEHFGSWADFGIYEAPIPWGFLVHALEHGAIVLAYRCEAPCSEITDALRAVIAAHGPDPLCRGGEIAARFIMVPDPELEWPVAALAWEHVYLATCIDPSSLAEFVEAHYGRAPEDLCAPGIDRSAAGWCP